MWNAAPGNGTSVYDLFYRVGLYLKLRYMSERKHNHESRLGVLRLLLRALKKSHNKTKKDKWPVGFARDTCIPSLPTCIMSHWATNRTLGHPNYCTTTFIFQVGPKTSWQMLGFKYIVRIELWGPSSQLQKQGSEIIPRESERVIWLIKKCLSKNFRKSEKNKECLMTFMVVRFLFSRSTERVQYIL